MFDLTSLIMMRDAVAAVEKNATEVRRAFDVLIASLPELEESMHLLNAVPIMSADEDEPKIEDKPRPTPACMAKEETLHVARRSDSDLKGPDLKVLATELENRKEEREDGYKPAAKDTKLESDEGPQLSESTIPPAVQKRLEDAKTRAKAGCGGPLTPERLRELKDKLRDSIISGDVVEFSKEENDDIDQLHILRIMRKIMLEEELTDVDQQVVRLNSYLKGLRKKSQVKPAPSSVPSKVVPSDKLDQWYTLFQAGNPLHKTQLRKLRDAGYNLDVRHASK
ncbi:hypothetical protein [Shimazuella kribbensis]|uniref:hypothetical protein n=1 Tax=Shimazuella kribbensis TaxID=139808 RepID=UPI000422DFAC|nr:hypothetical protein [Shimazuella kribbensis]